MRQAGEGRLVPERGRWCMNRRRWVMGKMVIVLTRFTFACVVGHQDVAVSVK